MKHKVGAAVAVAVLAVGGLAGTATTAHAATAPSCVKHIESGRTWLGFPWVKIRNDCKTSQRVKVIWAWAPDSPCKTLAPGKTFKDETGVGGRFDGLVRC